MHDQLDAMQSELLHRGFEGMNYYLLYNQKFIVVHGSTIVQIFGLISIWFSVVNQVQDY